ncbi:S-layer homology domain-containing protein [Paenibacillus qinlingensis]|uniref:RCC1 domain-containing protein n=1 Tax=Paenibacillus qinlingensis TaxID=1837343 RepID=UPI0015677ADF|nr:S-layer homology domain-containing protein [Paenibacillus qinlingensis]NQX59647.1 S-layer homology domain-containing protein [Paenibacillus qinlingensis]
MLTLNVNWRRIVYLVLSLVVLFSTIVPFGVQSVSASQDGMRSLAGIQVSAGEKHSLALKADGTVVAWGNNTKGQTTVPVGMSGVMSIAAGWQYSLALKSDGTVVGWGDNTEGQRTVPGGLSGVIAIAAGWQHSLALKSDGTVVGWGNNDEGQASVPSGLTDVVAISAGRLHSLALKSDGTVVAWGNNDEGQVSVLVGLNNVVAIAAGAFHSLALKSNGTVVAWGLDNHNQSSVPAGLEDVVSVAAGEKHSLALKSDGTIIGWGDNTEGQLTVTVGLSDAIAISAGGKHSLAFKSDGTVVAWGDGSDSKTTVPVGLSSPIKGNGISAGLNSSLALKSDGTVAGWGLNIGGQATVPNGLNNVVDISAGGYHSLALKSDGTVVVWGSNIDGQKSVPGGLSSVVAISAGARHSLALKSDGTVVAWGGNTDGQSTVPVGLKDVVAIAAGGTPSSSFEVSHSLALKSDGTVVAWGSNFPSNQSIVPVGLSGVVAIAAGDSHSLALKSDGTIVAWGHNTLGQITVPSGLNGVVAIAAGDSHSLALKSDGTVVAWGNSASGLSSIPSGLNGVVAIAAGAYHSLAIKADGTIVGWGRDNFSQRTAPGDAKLSGLTLQEGNFTEAFNPTVTAYTYYYDGHSQPSVHVTPILADTGQTVMYVNNELLPSGGTKTINLAGVTTDTVIPVRVEPYLLPSQTYTITLEIDETPPSVQFGTNGRIDAAKTAATVVTVSDTQSGVDTTSLTYAWTQGLAAPTSGWSTFSNLDTFSQTSGDGNWYLHIRATDNVGNVKDAVSSPFVLDNTAPTTTLSSSASGTVNAAFLVTITFSEGVNGLAENELVVGNGTASDLVSVSAATYTASITPMTSGQVVTVAVGAAAAADAVGNDNTASNTLSLLYDTTQPVVAFGGFTDQQQFATPPDEVSVSVSEAVYWIAGGAQLTAANALSLISMKKDGSSFSTFTPSYDEPSRTFTLSFNGMLDDGVYEVIVAGNVVKNVIHNTLDAANASFIVAVPAVISISANTVSLPSAGGSTTVTVTGTNLIGQTLKVYVDGVEAEAATVSSNTNAEATITLPYNGTQSVRNHSLTVYLNGVEVTGQEVGVTVSAAPSQEISLSSNAELAKLTVDISGKPLGLSPAFTPGTRMYTAETDAEQVELHLASSDSSAIIKLLGERVGETSTVPLVIGSNVLKIAVQAEDGTVANYTLTINRMAPSVPSTPSASGCPFTDIGKHWAKLEICEAAELGIVVGVSADTFVPDGYVTRTEFAAMLLRALRIDKSNDEGDLPFSDKNSIPEWARTTIWTAVDKGILDGYSDGTLKPNQTVNRTEMAAMVAKVMNWNASNEKSLAFADEASIPAWAKAHVETIRERGILVGRAGNQFVPNGVATRAEAAVMLLRFWKFLK